MKVNFSNCIANKININNLSLTKTFQKFQDFTKVSDPIAPKSFTVCGGEGRGFVRQNSGLSVKIC